MRSGGSTFSPFRPPISTPNPPRRPAQEVGTEGDRREEHMARFNMLEREVESLLDDLSTALAQRRPWSLVRLGDGEVHALRSNKPPWSLWGNYAETQDDVICLRAGMLGAIERADWVGRNKSDLHDATLRWFCDQGMLKFPEARIVDGYINLWIVWSTRFNEMVLRNESLFLAGKPMQQWLEEVLRPRGLAGNASLYGGKTEIHGAADAQAVCDAFQASGAHVGLFSLGVWALGIADYAKSIGRVGIDFGHGPEAGLTGIPPEPPRIVEIPRRPGAGRAKSTLGP